MSRVSPSPECLPDTRIQTRAKSARIQSQRSLSHESTIDPPTLLNKPLEVGMPTSSGFIGVLENKNNDLSVSHTHQPNISLSGSYHTSQIDPCFSPNSDLAITTQNNLLFTKNDINNVQTIVGESKSHLTLKDNLPNPNTSCKDPQHFHTDHTMASFMHDTHNDYIPYTINSNTKINHNQNYSQQAIVGQFQPDIKVNSSMHNIGGYHNTTNSTHLGTKVCLPYQVSSEVRDISQAINSDNLASATTEQELQMVELEIERQAKRLKELKLQKRKKTLLSINKEAHELELDMQASCRDPLQQTCPSRTKIINGLVNARGEYNHIDNNSMRTTSKPDSNFNNIVDFNLPGGGYRGFNLSNRISELKSIIKIDITANPRDEISYFEDMCRSLEIFNSQLCYQVLTSVWPHKDIRNYYTTVEYGRRCYKSLIDYLSNRDGQLGRVLLPRPDFNNLNGQALELEVTKWEAEMKDSNTLRKFLYIHLAPEHLKGKMREILSLDIENFKRRCRDICDANHQRSIEASRNINYNVNRPSQRKSKSNYHMNSYRHIDRNSGYQNNANNYFGHQDCNFIPDTRVIGHPIDNFQGRTHQNNTPIVNGYQGRQNSNHNNTGNNGTLSTLCHRHRKFGNNAYECAAPGTCEMAGIRAQRPTKNDFPSSSQ